MRHLIFEAEDSFEFEPGQFISVKGHRGDHVVTRAYSIASPPDGKRFELCLNRVREGIFSPYLFELPVGACLDVRGPLGSFTLRRPVSDSLMVATGTGIAPIRSILKSVLPLDRQHRFTLLFGVRYFESVLFRAEFEALAQEYPNFRFWPTLSRPGPGWTGMSGHVQKHLEPALQGRCDMDVYICGLREMVDDVRNQLKSLGFDRKRVIYERYD